MAIRADVADLEAARKLERAEAMSNAAFVESRARLEPTVNACWTDVNGTYALFDGPESPVTQAFGFGVFESDFASDLELIEEFFFSRGSAAFLEVCSAADVTATRLLERWAYTPIEHSVVLARSTAGVGEGPQSSVEVRNIDASEGPVWARVGARGWSTEGPGLAEFVEGIGRVSSQAKGFHLFLASVNGEPVAAGSLSLQNGVALFSGASTIPEGRGRGAQNALFEARLRFAADRGYETAMVVTQPDSGSQRNAERRGFRPMYSRTKWQLSKTT
jgi:GNAT superfamily N-acetyltransferase